MLSGKSNHVLSIRWVKKQYSGNGINSTYIGYRKVRAYVKTTKKLP